MVPRVLPVLILLLAPLAGCIELPEDAVANARNAQAPAPWERIDGMTASVTQEDVVEACPADGVTIPPHGYCAQRTLVAEGRIGVTTLPLDLRTINGAIRVDTSQGDAWRLVAVAKVEALTEEDARRGLDETWTWTHEANGRHAIQGGPTQQVPLRGARLSGLSFDLLLPEWVFLQTARLHATNGALELGGFDAGEVDLETTNGAILLPRSGSPVRAHTTNGAIEGALQPAASGAIDLQTTNGAIALALVESRAIGYDLDAQTTNGRIQIGLQEGQLTKDERNHKHFTTRGFDARSIQMSVTLQTTNGKIVVES